ncbi:unnamed protein product [Hymenolepis diminuta]|uniref:Cyclin N-terminal domain-containing protein n=1 Tax=Hymenolepis diminuta TaxID=6216 RepID=A0A158QCX1_HYMDI|nr:unnamed protein product [Hymenolepis diminuta]
MFRRLEDLVLSRDPSKTLQPNFVTSVYKESEISSQSNFNQEYNTDQDIFKPLVLRSFTNVDDLDIFNHQNQLDSKSSHSTYSISKPFGDKKSAGKLLNLHLSPLSLGQIRLTLFLIDCYLIATRFYNTYLVLREILTDKRLIVDAASYISVVAALPIQKHLNGDVKLDGSQYSSFHEETHYQCGHTSTSKPDTDDIFKRYQRYQPSALDFIRPIKSVQDVGGSSASFLHMSFARTNRFIIIFFICATVLFLAFFAISVNHRFLQTSKNAVLVKDANPKLERIGEIDYYKRSEILIRNHVGEFVSQI